PMAYSYQSVSQIAVGPCDHKNVKIIEEYSEQTLYFGLTKMKYAKIKCVECNHIYKAEGTLNIFSKKFSWKEINKDNCKHEIFQIDDDPNKITEKYIGSCMHLVPLSVLSWAFTDTHYGEMWLQGQAQCKLCDKIIFVTNMYTLEKNCHDKYE